MKRLNQLAGWFRYDRVSLVPVLLTLSLYWLFTGCRGVQTVSRNCVLEAKAEDLLLCREYEEAVATFRQLGSSSQNADTQAKADLGVGRAYLEMGNFQKSLDSLYAARRRCKIGPLRVTIERLIGEAAFANKDYSVAWTNLERGLKQASGKQRELILVKLHICAQMSFDSRAASQFLKDVSQPLDPELEAMIQKHRKTLAAKPSPPNTPSLPPAPQDNLPGRVRIIPRNYWDAAPVRKNVTKMGKISRLTVHHSGGPTFWGRSEQEAAEFIRSIQRNHQNENRWADIGYHYVIDRSGRVWEGRPLRYQGAHASGLANRGNIGVVMLGNYMKQDLTSPQQRSLRDLLAQLCNSYRISSSQVFTHSEVRPGHTACPGPVITRTVKSIRNSL